MEGILEYLVHRDTDLGIPQVMAEEQNHCVPLEGTESLDLHGTELAKSVLLLGKYSALLAQALLERAAISARLAAQTDATQESLEYELA